MGYPDIQFKKDVAPEVTIRKAMKPLLDEVVKPAEVEAMVKSGTDDVRETLKTELVTVMTAIGEAVKAIQATAPDLTNVATKGDVQTETLQKAIDATTTRLIAETTVLKELGNDKQKQLIEGMQQIYDTLNKAKPLTDKGDPTDYLNVRLTDGTEFYKAIDKMMTAVADSYTGPSGLVVSRFDSISIPS
jgi:hypothetical protein